MKKTKQAVCVAAWSFAIATQEVGKTFTVKKSFFNNGESWLRLVDDKGVEYDAPSIFFDVK